MKRFLILGAALAVLQPGLASEAGKDSAPLRGGICYAQNPFRDTMFITCPFIGKVKSVNEIYEKGFRVVSAGTISRDSGMDVPAGMFFVIEERR